MCAECKSGGAPGQRGFASSLLSVMTGEVTTRHAASEMGEDLARLCLCSWC